MINVMSRVVPSSIPTVNQGVYWRDDFDGYNAGANNRFSTAGLVVAGTGGGGAMSTANITQPQAGRYGIIGIQLGTTSNSTGNGVFFGDLSSVYASNGEIIFDWAFQTPSSLSDATNEYVIEMGFSDVSTTGGAAANGMIIQYKRTVSTNFSAYVAKASASSSVTTADSTNFAVATSTWYNARIYVNPAGTQVDFYVAPSGSQLRLLGSATGSNIPNTTSNKCYPHFQIYKGSVHSQNRILYLDWAQLQINFGSLR